MKLWAGCEYRQEISRSSRKECSQATLPDGHLFFNLEHKAVKSLIHLNKLSSQSLLMNKKVVVCLLLLFVITVGSGCVSEPITSDENANNSMDLEEIEGLWLGILQVQGGMELRLLFNVSIS